MGHGWNENYRIASMSDWSFVVEKKFGLVPGMWYLSVPPITFFSTGGEKKGGDKNGAIWDLLDSREIWRARRLDSHGLGKKERQRQKGRREKTYCSWIEFYKSNQPSNQATKRTFNEDNDGGTNNFLRCIRKLFGVRLHTWHDRDDSISK